MKRLLILSFSIAFQLVRAQTPTSPTAGAVAVTSERVYSPSADEKAVLTTEKQRFDAQVKKDYAVLDQVLADDLIYTHSHGGTDTKQSYIQSIRDGKQRYDAIDMEEHKVRIYGNTAVINGICMVKAMSNGQTINSHLKYTDVYVRNGNQWQMVAWQSIKLAK
ncbi:nuclear transport factor 2 family protein [Spirosoma validum]|uniref:Nuclear transport factor 2 family protein n=1 Tax=Spirosoma validum TaxID=2771355 RepID=A0A927B150_9BACT|nr:nuclear transport factor 2 family protein [Spirosoma validum]MBD2753464.1 nuclear transport factor 2 family protein [Spirosoma validum]